MSKTPEEDLALVKEAVASVEHLKSEREAAKELGVAPKTLAEWRAGQVRPLRSPTRNKLLSKQRSGPQRASDLAELDASESRLEALAAARRGRALEALATAEQTYAEAARLRAQAMLAQSRAAENDSGRASMARPAKHVIRDLSGRELDRVVAVIVDRLEARLIARGEKLEPPRDPGEEQAG